MLGKALRGLFSGGHDAAAAVIDPVQETDAVPEDGYAVVTRSRQGVFINNAYDQGVGWQLRTHGAFDEVQMGLLTALCVTLPRDATVLDIGANIGVVCVVLARAVGPAARVLAFEPQRHLFNMLAGNLALNAADNVICRCEAVGAAPGVASLPVLNYRDFASFGSVELNRTAQSDAFQQAQDGRFESVPMVSVDSLGLTRIAFIKIDVEGMEDQVLAGAKATIARDLPVMYVEHLKSDKSALGNALAGLGYRLFDFYDNFVCIPSTASGLDHVMAGLEPYAPDTHPESSP